MRSRQQSLTRRKFGVQEPALNKSVSTRTMVAFGQRPGYQARRQRHEQHHPGYGNHQSVVEGGEVGKHVDGELVGGRNYVPERAGVHAGADGVGYRTLRGQLQANAERGAGLYGENRLLFDAIFGLTGGRLRRDRG